MEGKDRDLLMKYWSRRDVGDPKALKEKAAVRLFNFEKYVHITE